MSFPPDSIELPNSARPAPDEDRWRRTARQKRIEVSLYLRLQEEKRQRQRSVPGDKDYEPLDRDQLARERAATYAPDMERIERWAAGEGLAVTRRDPARRLVKVAGSAEQIERAFGTSLYEYGKGRSRFRGRSGPIVLPAPLAESVEGVFGLDTRPVGESLLGPLTSPGTSAGHLPSEFATLYDFPVTPGLGAGQTIALLEFGGAFLSTDVDLAFAAMGRPKPVVVSEAVSGAAPRLRDNEAHDREVALNIQVAGGLAPGAKIVVYFARNDGQGWVDAVSRAIHDSHHKPTIISISWAAREKMWQSLFPAHLAALSQLFKDAAQLGITVLAAAGNRGATWQAANRRTNVGYPASDPFVCGCGGTSLVAAAGGLSERVWNRPTQGISGGGLSELFGRPAYQAGLALPANPNGSPPGRGVPDVAGVSDRRDGYKVFVYGSLQVLDGTSAVAPLWAALVARINEANGRRAGFFLPRLYAAPGALNDVAVGDNRVGGVGYAARPGWDPCTGLGSPVGTRLRAIV